MPVHRSHQQRARNFGLLDAMLLLVAVAVGLAFTRAYMGDYLGIYASRRPPVWVRRCLVTATNWLFALSPVLGSLTMTVLVLHLRQPRPRLYRLASRPGWVALCHATVGIVIGYLAIKLHHSLGYGGWGHVEFATFPVGVAVAAGWFGLAVSGRWRATPDWLDRAGRVMGVMWLSLTMLLFARVIGARWW